MKKRRLTSRQIAAIRNKVCRYYSKHKRDLPWRKTANPYHVYVSEVMLQQTQVDRVAQKFPDFIKAFPNWQSLAKASTAQVLKEWQGLGYNRRALFLKRAAEKVVADFHGKLPDSPEQLITLPGIGKATAASVAVFAFNKPAIFIETNIRTVFIHHFFPKNKTVSDADILPLLEQTIDTGNPYRWYSALMDYGTMLKKEQINPSRRSKHYIRQSRFEGSTRQLRGRILKLLLNAGQQSFHHLCAALTVDAKRVKPVLAGLVHEGFINKKSSSYSINQ
jgi:A/G-specific adenine glycosylase